MTNPFIVKAERKSNADKIAERNYRALYELFSSYDKSDNSPARERIRLRVIEAREALEAQNPRS